MGSESQYSIFKHVVLFVLESKVGVYLKTPRYPIWLVCSESHFSVLFGLQQAMLTSQDKDQEFDLYYYDGLANQEEEIRLTVCMQEYFFNTVSAILFINLFACVWLNCGVTQVFVSLAVGKNPPSCQDVDTDLVPPLELCIRTR